MNVAISEPVAAGACTTSRASRFPLGKTFAFTVFDDTDNSTVENVGPVYRLIEELGLRTTKSVWPLSNVGCGRFLRTAILQDSDYLAFVRQLRGQGFEISLHGVCNHHATRDVVWVGMQEFSRLIGEYPRSYSNHSFNRENIYWGAERFTRTVPKLCYKAAALARRAKVGKFEGQMPGSAHFWGDICRQYIKYVRNFVFDEINLDRVNPTLPFHDPRKPFVNYWFSSSLGASVSSFCKTVSEANQDRLESEHGMCIIYTHFSKGFCDAGVLNPRFESLLRRLAAKNGWFVTVSELLDFLLTTRQQATVPPAELAAMERRWLLCKLWHGSW